MHGVLSAYDPIKLKAVAAGVLWLAAKIASKVLARRTLMARLTESVCV